MQISPTDHILRKELVPALWLAGPGVAFTMALTGVFAHEVFDCKYRVLLLAYLSAALPLQALAHAARGCP
jgi:NhaP-type Na+/H+ and K+/H+ antiporter